MSVATLWEDFAKYVYLPRLRDQQVLLATVEAGPASTAWQTEGFAVAAALDDASGRYLGLTAGSFPGAQSSTALVVRPDVALSQLDADAAAAQHVTGESSTTVADDTHSGDETTHEPGGRVTTFRGEKQLDPNRPVKDFGAVTEEVLQHLVALTGADVEVTLHIKATKFDGFDDGVIRTVTENARTLKFEPGSGFSEE